MPNVDTYEIDSGLVTQSSTSQTAILELRTAATKRVFVVGYRINIGVTAAAAGNSVMFTIARAANTPSGGTAVTPRALDPSAPAALCSGVVGSWATAPTLGNILWEQELPQTTGSAWEEFPPLGYEIVTNVSTSLVGFVTTSVATATPLSFQFVCTE